MQAPVLILGASGALGGAIARKLSAQGMPLVMHGHDNPDKLEALAKECADVQTVRADLNDEAALSTLFDDRQSRYAGLSGVVLSVAKPFPHKLTHRTPWAVFEAQMDSQLKAAHLCLSAAHPLLKSFGANDTARVLIISTEYILGMPPPKTAPYVAAKAALSAYAQVIAQEWLSHNIRVHICAPGMVESNLTADLPQMYLEQVAQDMPEKCLTRAEDVANVAGFLMSPEADTLYGAPIAVTRGVRKTS